MKQRFNLAVFFILMVSQLFFWLGILLTNIASKDHEVIARKVVLVQKLHLTDYCFSTESRHTRNIGQPELLAPFQDFPGLYDHTASSAIYLLEDSTIFQLFSQKSKQ